MLIVFLGGCAKECIHGSNTGKAPESFKAGSANGHTLTGSTGLQSYDVADYHVCGGYTVYHTDAQITWGDGNSWSGWVAGGPTGALIGENSYSTPNVYHVHSTVNAVCTNNNSADWGDSASADSTIYVYPAPISVASIAFAPPTIKVNQQATVTVTLSTQASANGTSVEFMSPNLGSLKGLPLNILVPAAQKTKTFKVTGLAAGAIAVYASSGEGTATAGATLTVN
jgi:hypothetical protein